MLRAQVSFEFMVVYAILMAVFLFVFAIYFDGTLNLFQNQDGAVSRANSQSIAAALNYVYLSGDGASYNFTLSGIANAENLTVSDFAVTSARSHGYASAPLLDSQTNVTSLGRGSVLITNTGGLINVR
ncbi:hypothetical protein HY990_02600 [Candidatus Micrarchaeota archaeon]|nr:hypothetical protein [Candidatus Micrarchaeota archaeon]